MKADDLNEPRIVGLVKGPTIGSEIPQDYGRIERVNALLSLWFPNDKVSAVETSPAVPRTLNRSGSYMRFNLVVTYRDKTYVKEGQIYSAFCEATVARYLGQLHVIHECLTRLEIMRAHAFKNGLPSAEHAYRDAIDAVPSNGWHVLKNSEKTFEDVG